MGPEQPFGLTLRGVLSGCEILLASSTFGHVLLPCLRITYRPDLDLLTVRWLGESPLAALQGEYDTVLAQLQVHRTARLLLDIRRRDAPSHEMTHWFNAEWLPPRHESPGSGRAADGISGIAATFRPTGGMP